jgi:uncharacterized repeat protein (TIGR01451 family)
MPLVTVDLPAEIDADSPSEVMLLRVRSCCLLELQSGNDSKNHFCTFINPLPAGSSGNLQFAVRFPGTSAADGTLALPSTPRRAGPVNPNDQASVSLEANVPQGVTNLEIWISPNISPMLGQDVTYTIAVDNWGTTSFLNPVIVDQLPAGAVYVSSSPNRDVQRWESNCDLDKLDPVSQETLITIM